MARGVSILLSALPPLYLAGILVYAAMDFPVWDSWEFVPILEKSYGGTLSLGDLWAPHNEHRYFFVHLFRLPLAHGTGWSAAWEMVLCVGFPLGTFFLLLHCLRRADRKALMPWVAPVLSLMIFSLGQAENWVCGDAMAMFFSVFITLFCMTMLAKSAEGWGRLVTALLAATVASYSFANGMVIWPVGALILTLLPWGQRKRLFVSLFVWLCAAILVIGFYFVDFHKPTGHPDLLPVWRQPATFFYYVLSYLGSPVAAFGKKLIRLPDFLGLPPMPWLKFLRHLPALAGLAGVLGLAALWRSLRRRDIPQESLLPFLGMGLYAIGGGLITGIARAGFGSIQALSLRYATISIWLWIAVVSFLTIAGRTDSPSPSNLRASRLQSRKAIFVYALTGLIALGIFCNVATGTLWFLRLRATLLPARSQLWEPTDAALLARITYDPSTIAKRIAVLRKYRISVFKEDKGPHD